MKSRAAHRASRRTSSARRGSGQGRGPAESRAGSGTTRSRSATVCFRRAIAPFRSPRGWIRASTSVAQDSEESQAGSGASHQASAQHSVNRRCRACCVGRCAAASSKSGVKIPESRGGSRVRTCRRRGSAAWSEKCNRGPSRRRGRRTDVRCRERECPQSSRCSRSRATPRATSQDRLLDLK